MAEYPCPKCQCEWWHIFSAQKVERSLPHHPIQNITASPVHAIYYLMRCVKCNHVQPHPEVNLSDDYSPEGKAYQGFYDLITTKEEVKITPKDVPTTEEKKQASREKQRSRHNNR